MTHPLTQKLLPTIINTAARDGFAEVTRTADGAHIRALTIFEGFDAGEEVTVTDRALEGAIIQWAGETTATAGEQTADVLTAANAVMDGHIDSFQLTDPRHHKVILYWAAQMPF